MNLNLDEALVKLEPFLMEEASVKEIKSALAQVMIHSWRQGFRLGRVEGKLDQHMLGGES